jgi:hypothetical protein
MTRNGLWLAAALFAAVLAMGAASPAGASVPAREPVPVVRQWQPLQAAAEDEREVEPGLLWTLVGVTALSVVGGSLYLFKRRIGAFPRNPDWVAPISVMPAGQNAEQEADYPPPAADHH